METLEIQAVHYEYHNGVGYVFIILPDGRVFEAIRDGHDNAAHTAYVNGFDTWRLATEQMSVKP